MENFYSIPIIGVIGEDFKFADLLLHINNSKESQGIILLIDSLGGDVEEGFKMRDALLNTKKQIIAKNIGDVASIAVSIWLTAEKGNRLFFPEKGAFLIHNPYVNPKELDMGLDSKTMDLMSAEMKKIEKQLLKQYAIATGSDENVLSSFMAENKPLTPEQIDSLGFANIVTYEFKAVAYFKNFNNKEMETKQIEEKLTVIEKLLNGFKNLVKPKNLMVQDTNGKEIEIEVETSEQIVEGVTATVDGAPAEGQFIIDGIVYTFEKGVLTKIEKPEAETEALKQQIDELTKQLESSNKASEELKKEYENKLKETQTQFEKINNEFISFKNQFSSGDPKIINTPEGGDKVRRAFKNR